MIRPFNLMISQCTCGSELLWGVRYSKSSRDNSFIYNNIKLSVSGRDTCNECFYVDKKYPLLAGETREALLVFASSCLFEEGFSSSVAITHTLHLNRLNVSSSLRVKLTNTESDINHVAESKQSQSSYWYFWVDVILYLWTNNPVIWVEKLQTPWKDEQECCEARWICLVIKHNGQKDKRGV
jgi:hypothetical protein